LTTKYHNITVIIIIIGHENGVNVLGLANGTILTTSTGESVNNKPANYQLRLWDPSDGEQLGDSIRDHSGPLRGICSIPPTSTSNSNSTVSIRSSEPRFATCSNDGSVHTYTYKYNDNSMDITNESNSNSNSYVKGCHSRDIQSNKEMYHSISDISDSEGGDNSPPFILACSALYPRTNNNADTDADADADLVSVGEDGSVVLWNTMTGNSIQEILHPSCVWCVLPLPNGDFLTGSHDGCIRWFSANVSWINELSSIQLTATLLSQVEEKRNSMRKGPSEEELAKCT